MKKTISTYWPVAMLVPIALAGYCHTIHPGLAGAAPHVQTAASVSDEFARGLSLGLVETDTMSHAYGPLHRATGHTVSQAL